MSSERSESEFHFRCTTGSEYSFFIVRSDDSPVLQKPFGDDREYEEVVEDATAMITEAVDGGVVPSEAKTQLIKEARQACLSHFVAY